MLGAAHSAANPLTAHQGITHGHAVGIMLLHVILAAALSRLSHRGHHVQHVISQLHAHSATTNATTHFYTAALVDHFDLDRIVPQYEAHYNRVVDAVRV